jgi:hypothetical protein
MSAVHRRFAEVGKNCKCAILICAFSEEIADCTRAFVLWSSFKLLSHFSISSGEAPQKRGGEYFYFWARSGKQKTPPDCPAGVKQNETKMRPLPGTLIFIGPPSKKQSFCGEI